MITWLANAGDGPVTIEVWYGGNGTGTLDLDEILPGDVAGPVLASVTGSELSYDDPDQASGAGQTFRVIAVYGAPGASGPLFHRCSQNGSPLPANDHNVPISDAIIRQGVPLPPDCQRNVPEQRRFSVVFL
jgi:hypothetical protein